MTRITRFAPSPTGELHLGHVYAAKVARDTAKQAQDGRFLLRQEDIDGGRVREEFYQQIEVDLRWLGLQWDGEVLRQSTRHAAYQQALNQIKSQGLAYPCFCTRKEIQRETRRMLGAPHGTDAQVYPGTCRNLDSSATADRINAGAAHSWRLDSRKAAGEHGDLSFTDERFGILVVDPAINGDVVLARKDIGVAYHLAVVVDDVFQEITHVTRGEDLLSATHVHRQLQAVLSYPAPAYFHHQLILDETGKRLAKRDAARSIRSLRENGVAPDEVLALAEP